MLLLLPVLFPIRLSAKVCEQMVRSLVDESARDKQRWSASRLQEKKREDKEAVKIEVGFKTLNIQRLYVCVVFFGYHESWNLRFRL